MTRLAACGLLLAASAAIAGELQVHVSLRDTGYMLGDLLDERVV